MLGKRGILKGGFWSIESYVLKWTVYKYMLFCFCPGAGFDQVEAGGQEEGWILCWAWGEGGLRHQDSGHQRHAPEIPEDPSAPATAPDKLGCLHQGIAACSYATSSNFWKHVLLVNGNQEHSTPSLKQSVHLLLELPCNFCILRGLKCKELVIPFDLPFRYPSQRGKADVVLMMNPRSADQQGNPEHAEASGALHHLGNPKPQVCEGAHLQAGIRKGAAMNSGSWRKFVDCYGLGRDILSVRAALLFLRVFGNGLVSGAWVQIVAFVNSFGLSFQVKKNRLALTDNGIIEEVCMLLLYFQMRVGPCASSGGATCFCTHLASRWFEVDDDIWK